MGRERRVGEEVEVWVWLGCAPSSSSEPLGSPLIRMAVAPRVRTAAQLGFPLIALRSASPRRSAPPTRSLSSQASRQSGQQQSYS